ncbi:hypothetical protein AMECASPLE_002576 [Ameca splendens]|uniref:Uncharacterized protein n=1 Tax=Ameca splendens TaxID=208324 RepID=A0ABV0YKC0_9TELE
MLAEFLRCTEVKPTSMDEKHLTHQLYENASPVARLMVAPNDFPDVTNTGRRVHSHLPAANAEQALHWCQHNSVLYGSFGHSSLVCYSHISHLGDPENCCSTCNILAACFPYTYC